MKTNEKQLERSRRWRLKNKEKISKYNKERASNGYYRIYRLDNRGGVTISKNELFELFESQNKCFYCGIPRDILIKHKELLKIPRTNGLTIDRINPNKGYEQGNIVLCCWRCNLTKSNFFSKEEMLEIADKYIKPKWNIL